MATTNGINHVERATSPASHLGKRKRTTSPVFSENSHQSTAPASASTQENLEKALQLIRKQDSAKSILAYALRQRTDEPSVKRQKTNLESPDINTIEGRIMNGAYATFDDLMSDIGQIKKDIGDVVRADGRHDLDTLTTEDVDAIYESLSRFQSKTNGILDAGGRSEEAMTVADSSDGSKYELLTLRMHSDGSVRQLFTALPQNAAPRDINSRRLPNGFELTDSAALTNVGAPPKNRRTFGEAFTSSRPIRPLERPSIAKGDEKVLNFIPPFSKPISSKTYHYTDARLETGAWLSYAIADATPPSQDSKTNTQEDKANALFKAAFSSFAPSTDHSKAVITEFDRSQQWFRSYLRRREALEMSEDVSVEPATVSDDILDLEIDSNFEEMLANYVSEADVDDRDESEKILDEISELLQSLTSYQTIRELDAARGATGVAAISSQEQATYELLKTQLKLLVGCLPPHALAKLNGDQLGALNLTTHISVTVPEITGTGQPDDYTLRRQRAAQAATTAVGRGGATVPARQSFSIPGPSYNNQAQMYNRNVSANAYAPRATNSMYNTPRAMANQAYTHQNYRGLNNSYDTPTAQQFQQPMTNGHGQSVQTPYNQRPSQPGYQQRAQDRGTAWSRNDSPQKPLLNGQTPQGLPPRPYTSQTPYPPANAPIQQRATEPAKMQQPSQQQLNSRGPMETPRAYVPDVLVPQAAAVNGTG